MAVIAADFIKKYCLPDKSFSILDIGCGYGRDALYLSQQLGCRILGIDNSPKAIDIAVKSINATQKESIQFECCHFMDLDHSEYDVVLSNLYQVLTKDQRKELRIKVASLLGPKGVLFLNNLSINEPEEYGKGQQCPDERHSFLSNKYLHFCTNEELKEEFLFVSIKQLYEHEYDEPRKEGKTHHHISWILRGEFAKKHSNESSWTAENVNSKG